MNTLRVNGRVTAFTEGVFPRAQETGVWGTMGGQGAYIRCEHGVAGRGLVHRHRQAEGARPQAAMLQQWDPLGRGWESGVGPGRAQEGWGGGRQAGRGAHSKAHRSLQGSARPRLAADMVEGEEQVVVLSHAGWKTQLELLVELRGSGRARLGFCWGLGSPVPGPIPSAVWPPQGCRPHCWVPHQCSQNLLPRPSVPLPPCHLLVVVDHRCEGILGEFAAAGLTKDDLGERGHEGPTRDTPPTCPRPSH